jgi:hypothetical protein
MLAEGIPQRELNGLVENYQQNNAKNQKSWCN